MSLGIVVCTRKDDYRIICGPLLLLSTRPRCSRVLSKDSTFSGLNFISDSGFYSIKSEKEVPAHLFWPQCSESCKCSEESE